MKILYAIQGTGNGHISRARDIIPLLQKKGDLDILISGIQADVELPYEVKYKLKGLSFIFGKKGGVDLINTYRKSNLKQLYKEIKSIPIQEYNLVINDFEPVSAWACRLNNLPCIGLSHQAAVINKNSPKPKKKDLIGKTILKNYAPVTKSYGFHFANYDTNIFTPVIRTQVREAIPEKKNHFTVYLPAYSDKRIIKILSQVHHIRWEVFSKNSKKKYKENNVKVSPICNDTFIESMVNSTGVLCGAGFETPAEVLFLKKKLMVIPMKGQYEQQCNAAALENMGVEVIKSLKNKFVKKITAWCTSEEYIGVNYLNETESIIDKIIATHSFDQTLEITKQSKNDFSLNEFKKISVPTNLK